MNEGGLPDTEVNVGPDTEVNVGDGATVNIGAEPAPESNEPDDEHVADDHGDD